MQITGIVEVLEEPIKCIISTWAKEMENVLECYSYRLNTLKNNTLFDFD